MSFPAAEVPSALPLHPHGLEPAVYVAGAFFYPDGSAMIPDPANGSWAYVDGDAMDEFFADIDAGKAVDRTGETD